MRDRSVLGWSTVAAAIVCVLTCAVAIAVDENGTDEKPDPSHEGPSYRATIRRAPPELGEAGCSAAIGDRQSPESDSCERKRDPGGSATEWVTDLADEANPTWLDQPPGATTKRPREKGGDPTVQDPGLNEILRIRRESGVDLYRGTIFERVGRVAGAAGGEDDESGGFAHSESDEGFADALRTAAATADVQPLRPGRVLEDQTWRAEGLERQSRNQYGPPFGRELGHRSEFVDHFVGGTDLVDDLRRSARGLDAKAADLEDRELYGDANRLRQLARRLRTTARDLRCGAPLDE